MTVETSPKSEEEISLKEIFAIVRRWYRYLARRKFWIILVGVCGALLALTYATKKKPMYIAELTFALEDEKPMGSSGLSGLASLAGIDLGSSVGGAFTGSNLMELIKSRRIVEQSLLADINIDNRQTCLADFYIEFTGMKAILSNRQDLKALHFFGQNRANFTFEQDSLLGVIYKRVLPSITVGLKDKKSTIISILVKSENERFAKLFTDNLSKEVSGFYIDTKSQKAKQNVAILQRQTDSVRAELNAAMSGVARANDNTFNLNPSLNIERLPSARRQIDVQANTAILTQLVANLELAKVTVRKETPLIQVIDRPIYPLEKQQLSRTISVLVGFLVGGLVCIVVILAFGAWKHKL